MARQARVVIPATPHHVTQRGNRRQRTFFCDADYLAYLHLAAEAFATHEVQVWAYCLMPNHVHLIATHVRYTRQVNLRERWTGYLWQGRFASFPMDEDYLRQCVRYVALNPVRAGLVERAIDWPWSSVRAHLEGRPDPLLTPGPVAERLGAAMAQAFELDVEAEALRRLRRASMTGRPLGAAAWIKALEASTGRALADPPMGRPRRASSDGPDEAQAALL
jgi:putative transposase